MESEQLACVYDQGMNQQKQIAATIAKTDDLPDELTVWAQLYIRASSSRRRNNLNQVLEMRTLEIDANCNSKFHATAIISAVLLNNCL